MHDLNYNMDGKHWAEDFMSRFGGDRRSEIDESLMLAWFCNAIMTGYDVGRSKYRKELGCNDPAALRAALEEFIREWDKDRGASWVHTPNILKIKALLPAPEPTK